MVILLAVNEHCNKINISVIYTVTHGIRSAFKLRASATFRSSRHPYFVTPFAYSWFLFCQRPPAGAVVAARLPAVVWNSRKCLLSWNVAISSRSQQPQKWSLGHQLSRIFSSIYNKDRITGNSGRYVLMRHFNGWTDISHVRRGLLL